jgi:hypothetical protein
MTPKPRSLPIEPLRPGQLPPVAPRGYRAVRIAGVQHLGRRDSGRTLCGVDWLASARARPKAICRTCAALIGELHR